MSVKTGKLSDLYLLNGDFTEFIGKKLGLVFFTINSVMLTFFKVPFVPSEPGIIKYFSGVVETILLVHSGRVFEAKIIVGSRIGDFLIHLVINTYWTLK